MQENADCERECAKGLRPGVVGKGRAGKRYHSSHSASSLLSPPRGGWAQAPLGAGCGSTNVPHIPLTYTTSTEVLSVPGPPNLSLFFLCCFFHLPFCVSVRKISKCRGWASFSGRQGSAKHFQLPQYETDFPWEHAQPASTTGTALEGTYQESLPSYQKKKNVSENSSVGKNDSVDFISFDK